MLVPLHFVIPNFADDTYALEPLGVENLDADYKLITDNADTIRQQGGADIPLDITIRKDEIDLAWHQREFEYRTSFAYKIIRKSDGSYMGCCYIFGSDKPFIYKRIPKNHKQFDAVICWWMDATSFKNGDFHEFGRTFYHWITTDWPFEKIYFTNKILPESIEPYYVKGAGNEQ